MEDMFDASTNSDDSSEGGNFMFRNNDRVMRSGDTIVLHSMALSEHVAMTQEDLRSLGNMIEELRDPIGGSEIQSQRELF